MTTKRCPWTGELFEGRDNQIYLNPQIQIIHKNWVAKQRRIEFAGKNKCLLLNLKILEEFLKFTKIVRVNRSALLALGYDFSTYTHVDQKNGLTIYYVYDIRMIENHEEMCTIFKMNSNKNSN